jgi:predicted nucleotide-binding protein (sugar kinase/HSP70/actin superfamily)
MAGTEVARSSMPELMGAYGCALQALDSATRHGSGTARAIGDLLRVSAYDTRRLECKGCENHCMVTRYTFAGGGNYYSGNKCERVFNNKGDDRHKGLNIYTYKYKLLFDRRPEPSEGVARPGGRRVVAAIPRILNMYEDYPFWHRLFTEAGFEVMLSSESTFRRYEGALGSVMSDNICFPAKLVHAHVKELDGRLAELPSDASGFIFMPYVVYERQAAERMTNSYNCPIVSAYSDVIRSAMTLTSRIDSPVINFKDARLLERQVLDYLRGWGVGKATAVKALRLAQEAQANYERQVKAKALDILSASRSEDRLTIMLAGRPYHTDPLVQHKLSEMVADLGVNVISDDLVRGEAKMPIGNTRLVRQWAYMNRIIKAGQWTAEQPDDVNFVMMTSFGCGPDSFIQDEIRAMLTERGKPFTLLKIDDVSNLGSLKLRVRSLIESLRHGHGHAHDAASATNGGEGDVSRPDENDGHLPPISRKILAPYFTEYLTPLLPPLCRLFGWDVEVLPPSDAESAEVGLQYANNEICYPATLIVGDMVKALQSGRYDTNRVSMVMTQTGGQCRATNYAALIRRAMDANGFGHVPLITLGVATSADAEDPNQDGALDVPWLKYASIITTMFLYGDTISKFYHGAVGRLADGAEADGLDTDTNPAEALRDKYLSLAAGPILRNDASALMELIAQAAADFDRIVIDKELPAVGIVGEIFLKFNPFAHQYLARRLAAGGVEVVPPMLSPFFLQNFVNVIVEKHMGLRCSNVPDFLVKSIYSLIWRRQKKINRLASRFRYFRPFTNIFDEAREVNGVVSLAAQFGEGWLLPSDVISMVRQGVNNVVSLQPFGCIANHVVAKGIEKKLKKMYPQLNYVSLDFDPGVSAVNVTNRLLLFLDSLAS